MNMLVATNDDLIYEFLKDKRYMVYDSGVVVTCVGLQGHESDVWRKKVLTNKEGYLKFRYKYKGILVHRLIYAAFVGPLDKDLVVNHKDGNRSNNTPANLELVTQSSNNYHAHRTLGKKPRSTGYKITQELANEIRRQAAEENARACDLARKYSVAKSTMSYILNRKTWVK